MCPLCFLTDSASLLGPSSPDGYAVAGRASISQPLLRGAGTSVGELELRSARVGRSVAERAERRVTSQLVRDVLLAYWELWFAGEAARIDESALELARRQESEAQARVAQGALARTDVLTFSTRVAELEESVVAAGIQRTQRSLELARLMGSGDPAAGELVATAAPPPPGRTASRADIEAALRGGSVELAELEQQVRLARTRAEIAGDAGRPRLDLEGFVESQGVSERVPRAFARAGQMSFITAHVGLVFELPLDDSRKNAERASAILSVRLAEQNLKAARDRIAADAVLVVANEAAAEQRLSLAQRTMALAKQTSDAERARFEFGQSIAIQVQQAEEDLRRAQLRVARARVDLVETQVVVSHLGGRLLEKYLPSGA